SETPKARVRRASELNLWDRELVEVLLSNPDALAPIAATIEPAEIESPECRAIYLKFLEFQAEGVHADFDRLMLESEDPAMKSLLVELDDHNRLKSGSDSRQRLEDVLASFQRRKEDAAHLNNIAALKEGEFREGQENELLDALMADLRTRHR